MPNTRLARFREHKDDYFAHGDHSPLTPAQRAAFRGLEYFDEDPDVAFTVPLDRTGPGIDERIALDTTDGDRVEFVRAGRIAFLINGQTVTLSVLKDLARGRYFLPFRDETAGTETYVIGRYLDPQERPDGALIVDFNYAYNPYCAYSDGWSCPIPPAENEAPVRIAAGERTFGHDAASG